jgi:hypothetical protein
MTALLGGHPLVLVPLIMVIWTNQVEAASEKILNIRMGILEHHLLQLDNTNHGLKHLYKLMDVEQTARKDHESVVHQQLAIACSDRTTGHQNISAKVDDFLEKKT